jgi:hypothetical protein
MDDREFWIQLRRGLVVMLDAIEQQYDLPRSVNLREENRRLQFELRKAHNGTTRDGASSLSTPDKESA